ncbi:C-type lectin domain family 17, member A-like [Saccostrea echinata]|uniref:C-type lectin domain family 17, member A-like n=1 Tax=Saccostrea echinata TaxID=191078 RepID=UPI002A81615F|nr:C-type lectin domain family 17, member A-like [Saccostrea echinata]
MPNSRFKTSLASCANGWINFQEKCYFFGKTKETWYSASALCQSFGSKLAEPITQEEVTFLGRQTMQIGNDGDYYLGIHDIFVEGEWVYAFSRKKVTITIPWTPGGPDNYHEEDCALIGSAPVWHGLWGDAPCSSAQYYICEYDLDFGPPMVIG